MSHMISLISCALTIDTNMIIGYLWDFSTTSRLIFPTDILITQSFLCGPILCWNYYQISNYLSSFAIHHEFVFRILSIAQFSRSSEFPSIFFEHQKFFIHEFQILTIWSRDKYITIPLIVSKTGPRQWLWIPQVCWSANASVRILTEIQMISRTKETNSNRERKRWTDISRKYWHKRNYWLQNSHVSNYTWNRDAWNTLLIIRNLRQIIEFPLPRQKWYLKATPSYDIMNSIFPRLLRTKLTSNSFKEISRSKESQEFISMSKSLLNYYDDLVETWIRKIWIFFQNFIIAS